MTIPEEKLREMLAFAEKATPGPWMPSRELPAPKQWTRRIKAPGFVVADVAIASFDHVFACSPDTVKAIVKELIAARAEIALFEHVKSLKKASSNEASNYLDSWAVEGSHGKAPCSHARWKDGTDYRCPDCHQAFRDGPP